ncbi:2-oxoglutarate-Fe(II) type oxidoreductase ppzD-like [Pollicipes pollicipes]|uniref:2-oxoglutarate-Fe(II) type oxidoreductase ppzD-like n=1 Tax=Pollicipes pollicipes TaxID=41117 RepID=UPI0018857103|nr:2-oxoglutarate-Fe(II) type oxidoreductase ppzD-like [Pollicipes pollicipes]
MEEISIVDMKGADCLSAKEHHRQLGNEIGGALKGIGFVYLLNHGIPDSLLQSIDRSARAFFALPLETKMKCHRFVRNGVNGYMPIQEEVLSRSEAAGKSQYELKESWDMKPCGEDLPTADAPAFGRDLVQLMTACETLGPLSGAVLRVVHFPPVNGRAPPGAVRCATHSDWGSVTLLVQDRLGVLEVLSRSGRWVAAEPVPGAVFLNVGDLMQIWTGGEIMATKHRVLMPEDERRRGSGRLTLAFFSHPDDMTTVAPPSAAAGYAAVNAGQYVADKWTTRSGRREKTRPQIGHVV